jgi:hypothetical protein
MKRKIPCTTKHKFSCDNCSKSFQHKCSLKRHQENCIVVNNDTINNNSETNYNDNSQEELINVKIIFEIRYINKNIITKIYHK